MKWWRSRYVQHLEAENADLRETVKRMLNPQWRYLLYGEAVVDKYEPSKPATPEQERVKLAGRKTWADVSAQATRMFSPEGMADQKRKNHEQHLHSVRERIGTNG
jgi:hypothetical protein